MVSPSTARSSPTRLSAGVRPRIASRISASPRSRPAIASSSTPVWRLVSMRSASARTSISSASTARRGIASFSITAISARSLRMVSIALSTTHGRMVSTRCVMSRSCRSRSRKLWVCGRGGSARGGASPSSACWRWAISSKAWSSDVAGDGAGLADCGRGGGSGFPVAGWGRRAPDAIPVSGWMRQAPVGLLDSPLRHSRGRGPRVGGRAYRAGFLPRSGPLGGRGGGVRRVRNFCRRGGGGGLAPTFGGRCPRVPACAAAAQPSPSSR